MEKRTRNKMKYRKFKDDEIDDFASCVIAAKLWLKSDQKDYIETDCLKEALKRLDESMEIIRSALKDNS